jgi:F-box protein 9
MQTEESDELARFREEWKAEVRARAGSSEESKSAQTEPTKPSTGKSSTVQVARELPVELYRRAVYAEEQGKLNEALALYRRAFRREPNVDKLFNREELVRAPAAPSSTTRPDRTALSIPSDVDAVTNQLQEINLHTLKGRSPELEAVLTAFPDELMFISQDEKSLSPLEALPLEVIVDILMHLAHRSDTNAIERFASACRKARAVTLDPHIWR